MAHAAAAAPASSTPPPPPHPQPQERSEPGVCKVARYHGPLVLELKPMVPLVFRGSAEAFKLPPPRPAFAPVWRSNERCPGGGDTALVARDGSRALAHRLVLECRVPGLVRLVWQEEHDEVRRAARGAQLAARGSRHGARRLERPAAGARPCMPQPRGSRAARHSRAALQLRPTPPALPHRATPGAHRRDPRRAHARRLP